MKRIIYSVEKHGKMKKPLKQIKAETACVIKVMNREIDFAIKTGDYSMARICGTTVARIKKIKSLL